MPPKRKAASSPSDMTVKQLQAALKKAKVPYDIKATKAELVCFPVFFFFFFYYY